MNYRRILKQTQALTLGILILGGFQNCSEQAFSDTPDPQTATGGPNCREQLKQITTPIEIIMVMDVSGSNTGDNGTDKDKVVRGGSASRFFETYKSKRNFKWTMISFADNVTVMGERAVPAAMPAMIDDFMAMRDNGATQYGKALDAVKEVIEKHTNRAPYTKYVVAFMSDGKPNPSISDTALREKIEETVATVPGDVSVNTLYYGPTDDDASGRLRSMARDGGGNFLDTNANPTGNSFLISDLVVIPGVICD